MTSPHAFKDAYRLWLDSNPPDAASQWLAALEQDTTIKGIPTFPCPYIVDIAFLPAFRTIVETVSCVLDSWIETTLASPSPFFSLLPPAFSNPRLFALLRLEPPSPAFLSARYDTLFYPDTGQIQLLECNAGDPSGLGWVDQQAALLQSLSFFRSNPDQISTLPIVRSHHRAILETYRSLRSRSKEIKTREGSFDTRDSLPDPPTIAFACAEDSFVRSDHACLRSFYEAFGETAFLADPRLFQHRPGQGLFFQNQRIDLVIRDTIDEYILDPFWEATEGLRSALAEGSIVVLNPFRSALGDWKGWWEVLSDPIHLADLPTETADLLSQVIPWTRICRPLQTTSPQGQTIDLWDFACQEQGSLILKPTDGYGGFGIVIGAKVSAETWLSALTDAFQRPGSQILQTFLPLPSEVLPSITRQENGPPLDKRLPPTPQDAPPPDLSDPTHSAPQGTERPTPNPIQWAERWLTLSLWYQRPTFGGAFARASTDPIINVHQGGGIFPVFYHRV